MTDLPEMVITGDPARLFEDIEAITPFYYDNVFLYLRAWQAPPPRPVQVPQPVDITDALEGVPDP